MSYPERFGRPYPPELVALNVQSDEGPVTYCVGHEPDLTRLREDEVGEVYPWMLDEPVNCACCGTNVSPRAPEPGPRPGDQLAFRADGILAAVVHNAVSVAALPAAAYATVVKAVPVPAGRATMSFDELGNPMTVTAGRIDGAAVRLYRNGQCHALALALAATTGWSAAALAASECVNSPDMDACSRADIEPGLCGCQPEHLVVIRPDGALIDIEGAHRRTPRGYEDHRLIPMTPALWQDVLSSPDWRQPDLDLALSFVRPLLKATAGEACHGRRAESSPANDAQAHEQAKAAAGWSAPAWRDAAEEMNAACDHLVSAQWLIDTLIEDPANDTTELSRLRATFLTGVDLLRETAEAMTHRTS